MTRIALVLAHDGTDFAGWQLQEGERTVQGELEAALSRPCGGAVRVHASGRTDAGVHAQGQVAHADVSDHWADRTSELRHRVGSLLPDDLALLAIARMDEDFDARKSALSKAYRYGLDLAVVPSMFTRRFRLHVPRRLDLVGMRAAAEYFVGEQDFASLQSTGSSVSTSLRRIDRCELIGEPPHVDLVVHGSGFLRHMVRAMMGSLLEVATGRCPPCWIPEMLSAKDRAAAGPNVPARGLLLESVEYEGRHAVLLAEALAAQSVVASPLEGVAPEGPS